MSMGRRSHPSFAAAFLKKECRHLIARTSKSRAWLLSYTRSKPCLLKVAARGQGDGREWTRRICKPETLRQEENISNALAAAPDATRRPETLRALLRGTRGWNWRSECSIPAA